MPRATAILQSSLLIPKFSEKLWTIWRQGSMRPRIALAVSGGVDSMALACLCKESTSGWSHRPSFLGLIVDHKLRLGSTDEAESVAAELSRLGIESKILTLDWASQQGIVPTEHVENRARILRYRALGIACYAQGINSLLVAHHADDQAETVLLRICGGYYGSGLRGIKPRVPIPECEGIYGVDISGGDPWPPANTSNRAELSTGEVRTESGGVEVFRPLLPFRKAELVSYCRSNNIRWFEDVTNQDPRYASRNAIRHMQRQELLPEALRTTHLLRVSSTVAIREAAAEEAAAAALKRLSVAVDTKIGQARFTHSTPWTVVPDTPAVQARIARALLASVSPIRNIGLSESLGASDILFARCEAETVPSPGEKWQAAGVEVCPLSRKVGQSTWALQRAMPTRAERSKRCIMWERNTGTHPHRVSTTDRTLWDNRFWLQVLPCGGESASHGILEVAARFFSQGDMADLRETLSKEELQKLREALEAAPGDLRFTLPALVVRYRSASDATVETVVSLPSLGWSVRGWSRRGYAVQSTMGTAWQYDISYRSFEASLRTTGTRPRS